MVAKVEVLVASGYSQYYEWWGSIVNLLMEEQKGGKVDIVGVYPKGTALPDQAKNSLVGMQAVESKRRLELTDTNRSALVKGFMSRGEADWIWWLDDDTVPPKRALTHLLSLKRDFVGGVYFLGGEPYNPVAYLKQKDGLYKAYYNYPHGALVPVDSIGMGCTLIHRSVYEKIVDGHNLFMRPNGTLLPFPKGDIVENELYEAPEQYQVINNVLHVPLTPIGDNDDRPWPFYAMEYSRTEDHYFCELAANVGIRPYLDTIVVCQHLKMQSISRNTYLEYKEEHEELYGETEDS